MGKLALAFLVLATVITGLFIFRTGDHDLVIYSGRSKGLVDPLIDRFEADTGIRVNVRYGETAQLAVAIMEEGNRTPADLFWAQDAGALGALSSAGLLAQLPASLSDRLPPIFRNSAGTWVATSGRARVLAYSPARVDAVALPGSVFDLADPQWRGRVGWAPTNGSFQAFITAMRSRYGDGPTLEWVRAVRANQAKNYHNNNALIQAIAAGEIDLAITNHYYLLRSKAADPAYPVEQVFFRDGDIGNLVNVAGVAILASSNDDDVARRFIDFLLTEEAQSFFVTEVAEYPVTDAAALNPRLVTREQLLVTSPEVDLDALQDLEQTLDLLREAGLL